MVAITHRGHSLTNQDLQDIAPSFISKLAYIQGESRVDSSSVVSSTNCVPTFLMQGLADEDAVLHDESMPTLVPSSYCAVLSKRISNSDSPQVVRESN